MELDALARHGNYFRRIIAPEINDVVYGLCSFLDAYDIRTAYPLLLSLMDADLGVSEWHDISRLLESYLLRRAVCNLGTKNYNRIFLSLTRNLRKDGFTAERLRELLLSQIGESSLWPDNATFREAWLRKPLYGPLNNAKLVFLFSRLNQSFMSAKSEAIQFNGPLSIEHIMPQQWVKSWPLPDGTTGMELFDLYGASESDPRAIATRRREISIHTIGNLTILTTALNTAQSNLSWGQKRPAMLAHSLLPINQSLMSVEAWNEDAILQRGETLFAHALEIWQR